MSKINLTAIIIAAVAFSVACGDSSTTNSRTNSSVATNTAANRPPAANVQPATTPAASAVPTATPASNTALPTNTNASPSAERPRVVDPKKTSKATPPSDAIPSEDEMKKAFSKPVTKEDVNDPGMRKSEPMMRTKSGDSTMMRSKPAEVPMMKSNKKPGEKPQ